MRNAFPNEDAHVEKKDGTSVGPYPANFSGTSIIVWDERADVEEGDVVVRKLPNGKDERSEITEARFYPRMASIESHYQLKFRKGGTNVQPKMGNTFHIHGGQVQIGDHNTQNIVNALHELKSKIDNANASPEQKQQAVGLLRNLLAHPLVTSVLGGLAGGIV